MAIENVGYKSAGFEQLLTKVVTAFNKISITNVDEKIIDGLGLIGKFAGVERIFIIEIRDHLDSVYMSYLWSAKKDIPYNKYIRHYPLNEYPWLINNIKTNQTIVIKSMKQLPRSAVAERRFCLYAGIKSFIRIPIVIDHSVVGAFGVDAIESEKCWTDEQVLQFKIIAEILAGHYARWREEKRFIDEIEFERVITEIASDFTRASAEKVDSLIEESLHRICKVMNADFATVLQYIVQEKLYYVTHQWPNTEYIAIPNMPGIAVNDDFPWLAKALEKSTQITISCLDDFPKEAYKEKKYCIKNGIRSVLWVPFPKEGAVNGFIAINTIHKQQDWAEGFIQRLKLVGALFAKALEGERNLEQLREAQAETTFNRSQLLRMSRIQTLNEMTAGIAHEINQPLAAIDNYAQACRRRLESGEHDPEKLHDLVNKICLQSKRGGEVIGRLRNMIKKEPVEMSATDINEVVKDAINLADLEKNYRKYDIDIKPALSLPYVTANAVQIQQVVLNLIRNAQAAMESDVPQSKHMITIETKCNDSSFVEVSVADTGKGIPKEIGGELFEPFFTSKESGLGIGLSICRRIIEYHSGRIWYSMRPQGGTIFYFTLPIENPGN